MVRFRGITALWAALKCGLGPTIWASGDHHNILLNTEPWKLLLRWPRQALMTHIVVVYWKELILYGNKTWKGPSPHSKYIFLLVVDMVSSENVVWGTSCPSVSNNSYIWNLYECPNHLWSQDSKLLIDHEVFQLCWKEIDLKAEKSILSMWSNFSTHVDLVSVFNSHPTVHH